MSSAESGLPLVFFVTGCSTGLGRAIAEGALAAGHRVVATARNPASLEGLGTEDPERVLALALDVTEPQQIAAATAEAGRVFGRIDVLVNNAGYGYMAAVEEGEDEEIRKMFDTNYFAVIDLLKAVLPGMRERGRGHVVNISSMAGLVANPPNVFYSSSKFALESLSEGLSKELAPFGLKVTAIEPGAFRTDWSTRSMKETQSPIEAYAETVGARKRLIKLAGDKFPGDPRKVADAVLRVVSMEDPPLRLILGHDVYKAYKQKLEDELASVEAWKAVSLDVNLPSG